MSILSFRGFPDSKSGRSPDEIASVLARFSLLAKMAAELTSLTTSTLPSSHSHYYSHSPPPYHTNLSTVHHPAPPLLSGSYGTHYENRSQSNSPWSSNPQVHSRSTRASVLLVLHYLLSRGFFHLLASFVTLPLTLVRSSRAVFCVRPSRRQTL